MTSGVRVCVKSRRRPARCRTGPIMHQPLLSFAWRACAWPPPLSPPAARTRICRSPLLHRRRRRRRLWSLLTVRDRRARGRLSALGSIRSTHARVLLAAPPPPPDGGLGTSGSVGSSTVAVAATACSCVPGFWCGRAHLSSSSRRPARVGAARVGAARRSIAAAVAAAALVRLLAWSAGARARLPPLFSTACTRGGCRSTLHRRRRQLSRLKCVVASPLT